MQDKAVNAVEDHTSRGMHHRTIRSASHDFSRESHLCKDHDDDHVNNIHNEGNFLQGNLHNHNNIPSNHSRNHGNCNFKLFIYAIFFSLLLLWTGLQFLMVKNVTIINNQSRWGEASDFNSILSITNNRGNRLIEGENYAIKLFHATFITFSDLISTLLSSLGIHFYFPSRKENKSVEDEYIEIFYALLALNVLAMIPFWSRCFKGFRRKNRRSANNSQNESSNEYTLSMNTERQSIQRQLHFQQHQKATHRKLLYQTYLPAYLLAASADWLQGPYKYALYSSYGYTQRDIAHLFVAGYGSGMILGSVIGGLADRCGRKKMCLAYCASYSFSVMMKHCRCFGVLLLGRVAGGIATSLLFSVFESWLIRAHGERGLLASSGSEIGVEYGPRSECGDDGEAEDVREKRHSSKEGERLMATSFSVATYGSSIVAIGSGIVANIVVEKSGTMRPIDIGSGMLPFTERRKPFFYIGGYISAFDACLVPLALCAATIAVLWEENYGQGHRKEVEMSSSSTRQRNTDYKAGIVKKHSSWILDDDSTHATQDEDDTECGSGVSLKSGSSDDENQPSKNYNDTSNPDNSTRDNRPKDLMFGALRDASCTVWNDSKILTCCIIGSFFEGSMYIFIFMWTPALTSIQKSLTRTNDSNNTEAEEEDSHSDADLPFGWIFSSFMVCCMLGTIAFSHLSNAGVPASKSLIGILFLASLSFLAMASPQLLIQDGLDEQSHIINSASRTIQYGGMLMYEACVGAYYPAMSTVKGTIVPEGQRAAIYNVFRLPLNALVLLNLVWNLSYRTSFLVNFGMLLLACGLHARMVWRESNTTTVI